MIPGISRDPGFVSNFSRFPVPQKAREIGNPSRVDRASATETVDLARFPVGSNQRL